MTTANKFAPHWISAPGETIVKLMVANRITQQELADELSLPLEAVELLLHGRLPLSRGLAAGVARILGSTESFWLKREKQFQEGKSRLAQELPKEQEWIRTLPLLDMKKGGALPPDTSKATLAEDCLDFFDVESVDEWTRRYAEIVSTTKFRTSASFENKIGALSYWLRKGEIVAENTRCARWNRAGFLNSLPELRKLTRWREPAKFLPEMQRICSANGVALVIERTPKGCVASGATKFLSESKALLMLSFRYLSDDQFWFSFFHEAGHLVLHGRETFVEGEEKQITEQEVEANAFAEEVLIPSLLEAELRNVSRHSKALVRLALQLGLSPGILVGQMQHKALLLPSQMNFLKKRYEWH
ncbi:ImmA/IrrE family metallo-endopeptidase [Terriglobus sp.]|uniref:ImmA/IrrE family metallo-endopeptidase n=1 Tax=Terriglobus sp. TaxID=1889013 RepID=UPI003AFFDCB0